MPNTNAWNRARYTLFAPYYDTVVGFNPQRQRAIAVLRPQAGERVLIVGVGTGLDLAYLPPNVAVTAIDLTPAMVWRTRQRAMALQRPARVAVMDGQQLALPSRYFDAVVLHLILAVIPDAFSTIAEAARVLRPGGRAIIFDKFLPDQQQPSLARCLLNLVTATLFSDINRQLGPLLTSVGLHAVHAESAGLGGVYQIVLATTPSDGGQDVRGVVE